MATKDGRPILTELNNGIINATNAMPMKDITSDNGGSFELSRKLFAKAFIAPINYKTAPVGRSFVQRSSPAIEHGFIIDGPKSVQQKKWIGGNRDASSVAASRRKKTTGQIMTAAGPKAFTNTRDNNARIDALARVRGGGATVPPKVASRPVTYLTYAVPVQYYRIVAAGWNAASGGIVNYSSSTAYNVSPGIYGYTDRDTTQIPLYNVTPKGTFGRSYNVLTINRTSGATTYQSFDIFGSTLNQTAITNYLNGLSNNVIVIVATYDEPSTSGTLALSAGFINAMKACGATTQFGSASFYYRSAYILVGIPGVGVGNGLERYAGANNGNTGDPAAVVDLTVYVSSGNYTYFSG